MAPKLTDAERERIADLCHQGKSRNVIANEVGRSPDTVSRVADEIGHEFGRTNLARAREARSSYAAEERAVVAALALRRARELLDDFDAVQPVVIGGPEPHVRELALDARAQKDRAQAASLLTRTVLDVAKLDEKADGGRGKSLLERLVAGLDGGAAGED